MRRAFTLLEVLVVVAIIVVLASVASIAVFRELENSKSRKAEQDMMTLDKMAKAFMLKSEGQVTPETFNIHEPEFIRSLEGGPNSLMDPWGHEYQVEPGIGGNGEPRVVFFTINKDQQRIQWPR